MARPAHRSSKNVAAHQAPSLARLPRRGWALAGWAVLPLRAFLGVTFFYAGLQKLSNPNFFDANSSSSIQAQMIAAIRVSPLHALLGHLLQFATPIGITIAIGEIAVGLGTMLGLWTRIAAFGGMVISLSLFLTVSFHSAPYYTGADIVYLFAWAPLLIAGSGHVLSLDGRITRRASEEAGRGDPTPYALSFAGIQDFCGNYQNGRCAAQQGAPCAPHGCPVLDGGHSSLLERRSLDEVDRRTVVIGSAAAAVAGVAGLAVAGATVGIGRAVGGSPKASSATGTFGGGTASTTSPTTTPGATTTSGPTPTGTLLGESSTVPVGGAATFTAPNGDPGIVLQPVKGQFLAYDAICPHAGCTVAYSKGASLMVCPCHGSEFKVSNGDVITGPAPTGLTKYTITESSDGKLYLKA